MKEKTSTKKVEVQDKNEEKSFFRTPGIFNVLPTTNRRIIAIPSNPFKIR